MPAWDFLSVKRGDWLSARGQGECQRRLGGAITRDQEERQERGTRVCGWRGEECAWRGRSVCARGEGEGIYIGEERA